jgi:hypothetical protein
MLPYWRGSGQVGLVAMNMQVMCSNNTALSPSENMTPLFTSSPEQHTGMAAGSIACAD